MNKSEIIEVLAEVARRAGIETAATHPEDIAIEMSAAILHAGSTLDVINKRS